MHPHVLLATTLTLGLGLGGCATSKEELFGDTSHLPDMATVYYQHLGTDGGRRARDTRARGAPASTQPVYPQMVGYTRDAVSEIEQRFPTLPNPTLLMYVDPHLTAGGQPVPGYTTAFTLYEGVEYALPGEVAPVSAPPYSRRPGGDFARPTTATSTPIGYRYEGLRR